MIRRRTFLLSALGAAGITGLCIWGFGRRSIEEILMAMLRNRLAFLKLDDAGLRAFARDQTTKILAKRVSMARMRYHVAATTESSSKRFQRSIAVNSRRGQAEDIVVTTYLLSSDFYVNGSDENNLVKYIAYFDPMRACGNPFARPALTNSTTTQT
jgi:hypothetical protein